MVQLEELHYCNNCDAEFSVYPNFDSTEEIAFCPYCGSELDDLYEDDEELFDDDLDAKDDYEEI